MMAGVLASLLGNVLRGLLAVLLWLLVTPFWFAWTLAWFVLSYSWALAIAVTALTILFVSWRYRHVSRRRDPDVQPPFVIPELFQSLPVQPKNGWSLEGVVQSQRVFSRFFSALSNSGVSVVAASTVLEISSNQALQLAVDISELHHWIGSLRAPVQCLSPGNTPSSLKGGNDTIVLTVCKSHWRYWRVAMSVHRRVSAAVDKHLPFLSSFVPSPTVDFTFETIERNWYCQDDQVCCIFLCPRPPSSIAFRWSLLLFSPVPKQKDLSVATLVAMPLLAKEPTIQLLVSQLCALREHATMKELGVYLETLTLRTRLTFSPRSSLSLEPTPPPTPTKLTTRHVATEPSSIATVGMASASGVIPVSQQAGRSASAISRQPVFELRPSIPRSTSPYAHLDEQYLAMADRCASKLVAAADATQADGWTNVGVSKNIHIMKRVPQKGEAPINCVKGTIKMALPGDFVLRVLMDPAHATELDDMLKEMREIHIISPTVQLLHMMYKAMWPTTARDFVVVDVVGLLDDQTYVHGAMSVVDPRVPEGRGYVRGEVISGGYLIRDLPGERRSCEVTYLTQVDLKGNVPTFLVNKVTESQPQCAGQLRKIAEAKFAHFQANARLMREFEEKYPIYYVHPPSLPPSPSPPPLESPDDVDHTNSPPIEAAAISEHQNTEAGEDLLGSAETAGCQNTLSPESNGSAPNDHQLVNAIVNGELSAEERESQNMQDAFEASCTHPMSVGNLLDRLPRYDSQSISEDSQTTIPRSPSMSSAIDYPRTEEGIDFRTLGNQTAARVLEEMFHMNGLDLEDAATYTDQAEGWKYQGIEKDILIMKKRSKDSLFNSFIGKGIIELSPQEVFNCIRNPNQRFIFDNMLKELHIVKQIEDGLYILHLHHETNQCFLKQSRDFCLLVCERSEHNKKLLVGASIDVPECPPQPSITRGRILASGWMIEPCRRRGKLHTVVTYLVQTDIGGLPPTLVNFVSRRQPLAIAYLREYLYSTSLSRESKDDEESSIRWAGPRF